jgi:hypothetical protein
MTSSSASGRRRPRARTVGGVAVTALLAVTALTAGAADAGAASVTQTGIAGVQLPVGFHASVFASGGKIYDPDDITELDGHVFVGYQNGVGTMGEPSPTGNAKSTIVEYTLEGKVLGAWSVVGKVDGLGADPQRHFVIATANEDGNSSLYTVIPSRRGQAVIKHYRYDSNPLPHGGGTDSVVVRDGVIYISASNPSPDADGTTFSGPAAYTALLEGSTAVLTPVLMDDAAARNAVTGAKLTLNLSDPDSSEVVPWRTTRFGGEFVLDSQADGELIFLSHPDTRRQQAAVLPLSTQVDDTAFGTDPHGTLLVVDNSLNEIIAITGVFHRGQAFSAVPNDSTVIPGNLGSLNLATGQITAFGSGFENPHGLLFLADTSRDEH